MVQVLHRLPKISHPDLIVGTDHFDDAGVFRLQPGLALVQTVDFFPPLVDDPFAFGQIAAANSLSDIYAMGARPLTALNIVGFPDKDLPLEILGEILRGGAERVAAAEAVIVGGHSVRDAEIKYGLAVTGIVDPARVITNGGAQPGDVLILTKSLGSGVLTTAAKKGLIAESDLAEAIAIMIELNRAACEVMIAVGVHAATDITGFGLIGHAREIADASGVTLVFQTGEIPLMSQALDLARQGCLTRTHKSTLDHIGARLDRGSVEEALIGVLADAQTSGGLLISVSKNKTDVLLRDLISRGVNAAKIVGEVRERSESTICLM